MLFRGGFLGGVWSVFGGVERGDGKGEKRVNKYVRR